MRVSIVAVLERGMEWFEDGPLHNHRNTSRVDDNVLLARFLQIIDWP